MNRGGAQHMCLILKVGSLFHALRDDPLPQLPLRAFWVLDSLWGAQLGEDEKNPPAKIPPFFVCVLKYLEEKLKAHSFATSY